MKLSKYMRLLAIFALLLPISSAIADEGGTEPASQSEAALPSSPGIETASGEKVAAAIGHYARARSHIIAAINEFDKGYKIANPDAILDSKEWRLTLIDRAQDLQKVLDPQPRASKGGVKFEADTGLLSGAGR